MATPSPLYIAFLWHMHQPYYRHLLTGENPMPWVRLHGTKDYLDMVEWLEEFPDLRLTVNVVPSLLDQIDEYLPPRNFSDRFLDVSRKPAAELTPEEQRFILSNFFLVNWDRMVKPHPRYADLLAKRGLTTPTEDQWGRVLKRFATEDYLDLQVWFNLVWFDPRWIEQDPALKTLVDKSARFTEEDKQTLLAKQTEYLGRIIPRYRQLQESGRLEVSVTPYYHPILPLLCDTAIATTALPQMVLPKQRFARPEDAQRQLSQAAQQYTQRFGRPPRGLWPSEGSVSDAVVGLAAEQGFQWLATDEEVLWRTLKGPRQPQRLYRPYRLQQGGKDIAVVFRDHALSDLVGFVYSQWDAALAVDDFLKHLKNIHAALPDDGGPYLVSIILDGENAWEHYPNDGHDFLRALYCALTGEAQIRTTTFSDFIAAHPPQETLPSIHPGSWINGNFAIWIGHPEKNRAWDLLSDARETLARAEAQPTAGADLALAWKALQIAEGSDWNWWFGPDHGSAQDTVFDWLYREHLKTVYAALQQPIPSVLDEPIKLAPVTVIQEPMVMLQPVLDGRETTYYEWYGAGRLEPRSGAAMHRAAHLLTGLYFGVDATHLYLRVDLTRAQFQRAAPGAVLRFSFDGSIVLELRPDAPAIQLPNQAQAAWERIVELKIPLQHLQQHANAIHGHLAIVSQNQLLERLPEQGAFRLPLPMGDIAAQQWSA